MLYCRFAWRTAALGSMIAVAALLPARHPAFADHAICSVPVVVGPDGRASQPDRVVQRDPDPICEMEQEIIDDILADWGLADDATTRAQVVTYGAGEVKARMLADLLRILGLAPSLRTANEAANLAWFIERVRALRVDIARASIDRYAEWDADPCGFVPPEGFDYTAPAVYCSPGSFTVLFNGGRPVPPSYEDFVGYGVADVTRQIGVLAGGDGDHVLSQLAVELSSYLVTGGAVLVGGVAGGAAAAAAVVQFGSAVWPFAGSSLAGLTGNAVVPVLALSTSAAGSVFAAVTFGIVTAIVRTVQVVEAADLPVFLAQDLAIATAFDETQLRELMAQADESDDDAAQFVAQLLLAMVDATVPTPSVDPAAVPPSAPLVGDTAFHTVLHDGVPPSTDIALSFDFVEVDGSASSAYRYGEVWVIVPHDPDVAPRVTARLPLVSPERVGLLVGFEGAQFLVQRFDPEDDDVELECPSANCFPADRIFYLAPEVDPDGTVTGYIAAATRLVDRVGPSLTSGPTIDGLLEDGSTVTLSATATDGDDDPLVFRWEILRETGLGLHVSATYLGESVSHTFVGSGSRTIRVTVSDGFSDDSAEVIVDVAPLPLTLTVETEILDDGVFIPGLLPENSTAGRIVVTAPPGASVSADWDVNGTPDFIVFADGEGRAVFDDHPAFPQGTHPVRFIAKDGTTVLADEILPILVGSSRPTLELEVLVDGEFAALPLPEAGPPTVSFDEGEVITARLRVRDDGGEPSWVIVLNPEFGLLGLLDEALVFENVPNDTWVTFEIPLGDQVDDVSGLDEQRFSRYLGLAADQGGLASDFVGLHFTIDNVQPVVRAVEITSEVGGRVSVFAELIDDYPPSDLEEFRVDWGDGTESAGQIVGVTRGGNVTVGYLLGVAEHTYAAPGEYTIVLTPIDDRPADAVGTIRVVEVLPAPPGIGAITELTVGFVGNPTTLGFAVVDLDTAAGDIVAEIEWGDGTVGGAAYDGATDSYVGQHTYDAPGAYAIQLRAADDQGLEAFPVDGSLSIQLAPTVTATATQPPTPTPTPTVAANQVNIQCRRDQHTVLSRVVRDSLSEMVRCHDRRMQGKQSAATDCNDRDNAISPDRIAREEDKLRRRLDNACAGSRRAEAASPAAMGYLSCPAPCDAVEIANSYRGQADCLLCLAKEHSEALAAAVYGTPPSPVSRDEGSCQTRIARGTRAYLMARLTAQRRCQLSQDRGSESAATDCKAYDPRGRVARARGTLMNRIDRCTAGALGTLDGCGADRATTDACTAAAAEAVTDALFDAVYPVLAPF